MVTEQLIALSDFSFAIVWSELYWNSSLHPRWFFCSFRWEILYYE